MVKLVPSQGDALEPLSPKRLGNLPTLIACGIRAPSEHASILGISVAEYRERLKPGVDDALMESISEGESRLEQKLLRLILDQAESGGPKGLKASIWLAERLWPQKYGPRSEPVQQTQVAISFSMPRSESLENYVKRNALTRDKDSTDA